VGGVGQLSYQAFKSVSNGLVIKGSVEGRKVRPKDLGDVVVGGVWAGVCGVDRVQDVEYFSVADVRQRFSSFTSFCSKIFC
jgi:hypothetical protein